MEIYPFITIVLTGEMGCSLIENVLEFRWLRCALEERLKNMDWVVDNNFLGNMYDFYEMVSEVNFHCKGIFESVYL